MRKIATCVVAMGILLLTGCEGTEESTEPMASFTISKVEMAPGSCFRIRVEAPQALVWDQRWTLERRVATGWESIHELIVYPNKHYFQYRQPGFHDYWGIGYGGDDTIHLRLPVLETGTYRFAKKFWQSKNDGGGEFLVRDDFRVVGDAVTRTKERCRRPDRMRP